MCVPLEFNFSTVLQCALQTPVTSKPTVTSLLKEHQRERERQTDRERDRESVCERERHPERDRERELY